MKKLSALFLSAILLLTLPAPALAADTAKATTMRLSSTEGTVTLANQNGRSLTVKENMKLYSGYTIKTGAASYAYINLDDSKAVKLDASTTVEIRESGKKLEVLLSAGKLFFNVTVPLEAEETLEIRTSTIVTGIRGTSGVIDYIDEGRSALHLLDGSVTMQAVDPSTGKRVTVPVQAGQSAVVGRQETTPGSAAPIGSTVEVKTLVVGDVPGFAAAEIAKDTALQEKITQQSKLDVKQVVEKAAETLTREQEKAAETHKQVEQAQAKTENTQSGSPVVPNTDPPKDSGPSGGDSGGGSGDSGGGSGDSGSGSGDSGSGSGGDPQPPLPTDKTIQLNGTVSQEALEQALAKYDQVILTKTAKATILAGTVTIATGKSLEIESEGNLSISNILCFLKVDGTLKNAGTLTVSAGGSLLGNPAGRLENTGTLTNAGTLHTNGTVESTGAWNNQSGGTWTNSGSFTSSGSVNNEGAMENTASGHITASGTVKNAAACTWMNSGKMQLGAHGMENQGTLTMTDGLIARTGGSGFVVTGDGKIIFTGGLFRSDSDAGVIPNGSFEEVPNGLARMRGSQTGAFVLGYGLNGTIEQVGKTPTTIFISEPMIAADAVAIAADQSITLEQSDSGSLTVSAGIVNAGTLKVQKLNVYGGSNAISTIANTGTLTVGEDGTVSAGVGCAIDNQAAGVVTISGGTVELTKASPSTSEFAINGSFTYSRGAVRALSADGVCPANNIPAGYVIAAGTVIDGKNWWSLEKNSPLHP